MTLRLVFRLVYLVRLRRLGKVAFRECHLAFLAVFFELSFGVHVQEFVDDREITRRKGLLQSRMVGSNSGTLGWRDYGAMAC
jgi:hypothetical protein